MGKEMKPLTLTLAGLLSASGHQPARFEILPHYPPALQHLKELSTNDNKSRSLSGKHHHGHHHHHRHGVSSNSSSYVLAVPLSYDNPSSEWFNIRYFVDSITAFDGSDEAPIMVNMGGEGPETAVHCSSDMIANNAICVQVEHRFYGESLPVAGNGGISTDNYKKGLTVEANLADTAAVIEMVQEMYPIKSGNNKRPVLNFGGSYSGATCTWFRMKYPDLTAACVSSSGVVNAIFNYVEFDQVISEAVGPDCRSLINDVVTIIDTYFDLGQGNMIKSLFNATNLMNTKMGDTDFMYMVADGIAMIDQYGNKEELCSNLANMGPGSSDIDKIENLWELLSDHYGSSFSQGCFYDSECLKDYQNADVSSRSWRWQKCSQMAFLQSAPDATMLSMRSQLLTLTALEDQCNYVFGSCPACTGGNGQLQDTYGRDRPDNKGLTNTISLSFSDDPWRAATVQKTLGDNLPYCYTECNGCGHCGAGVSEEEGRVCYDKVSDFIANVLSESRFSGDFVSSMTGDEYGIAVDVNSGEVKVSGVSINGSNFQTSATVQGTSFVVDLSQFGGTKKFGMWVAGDNSIVFDDGSSWDKTSNETKGKKNE